MYAEAWLVDVLLQYLGFGVPAKESAGRRAATQADVANQSALTSAEEDNLEKDAMLAQVEARDLIEFGMIPVSDVGRRPYEVHLRVWFQIMLLSKFVHNDAYIQTLNGVSYKYRKLNNKQQPK